MKKKMKKILLIGIILGVILQGFSGCGKEQEIPDKFVLGDNLKNAIIQIALAYDEFDENTVRDDSWKDIFVSHFLQNSMFSFDYLSELQSDGGGIIDAEEVSYIQKALTNQMIDFDNDVDTYQSSSYELTGNITDYSIVENADDSDISYSHFVYLDLSEDDALRAAVEDMEIGTEVTVEFEKYSISDNYMYIVPKEVKS